MRTYGWGVDPAMRRGSLAGRGSAWTRAGGADLPGPLAGRVDANELGLHGWDLARAAGLPYDPDRAGAGAAPRSGAVRRAPRLDRNKGELAFKIPLPITVPSERDQQGPWTVSEQFVSIE